MVAFLFKNVNQAENDSLLTYIEQQEDGKDVQSMLHRLLQLASERTLPKESKLKQRYRDLLLLRVVAYS